MVSEFFAWALIVLYGLLGAMAIGLLLYVGYIMASFRKVVPYVPTPKKVVRHMLDLAQLKPADRVVDLGSGTGKIVRAAAAKHEGPVTGIEDSKLLVAISKILSGRRSNAQYVAQDFFRYPLEETDVILCFLTTEMMEMLNDKLTKELPTGSRIVSYMFALPENTQFEETVVPTGKNDREQIFLYRKR